MDGSADVSVPADAAWEDESVPTDPDASSPGGEATNPFAHCGFTVDIKKYTTPGSEFIVDAHTFAVSPMTNPTGASVFSDFAVASDPPWVVRTAGATRTAKFSEVEYRAQILDGSATARALLLGLPYQVGSGGTGAGGFAVSTLEDQLYIIDRLNAWSGAGRVLLVPTVMPQDRIEVQLARMTMIAGNHDVRAWHTNPSYQSGIGTGYRLDSRLAGRMIERGIALGVPTFLINKGMPLESFDEAATLPDDIGPAAATYPDANFVILNSAFEAGLATGETSSASYFPEGPYDLASAGVADAGTGVLSPLDRGVNGLITSMREHGIGPNENVYASLDQVWAALFYDRPTEAAHLLGKLLQYVGEDNVLWGTYSLPNGGPSPQIAAFRNFQIPQALRDLHGYPKITPEIRAKVFGLNAARLFCLDPSD